MATAAKTPLSAVLCFVALLCVAWEGQAESAEEDVVRVKLRDYVFHIPERNSMRGSAPFWLKWTEGLDDSSAEIRFTVPLEEVTQAIPAFRSNRDFTAVLAVLDDVELARYHDSSWSYRGYSDMWYGRGEYEGRRVETLGETGWYRVYRPLATKSWEVFRQRPDANTPLPDDPLSFYVAGCSLMVGGTTTDCLTYALFDRIVVDFWTKEENLLLIDELRDFMIAKVLEWKQPGE